MLTFSPRARAIQAVQDAIDGVNLRREQARDLMLDVVDGRWPAFQVSAWLRASAAKGETATELLGFRDALMARSVSVAGPNDCVDTCGTGGDLQGSFNASTAAALLAAAAGVRVGKAGNRAATSRCGSADVLEAAGVQIDVQPDAVFSWLDECGFVFLFSPSYHPSLARLRSIRRSLGIRTLFNTLGPLTNPLRPTRQVLGVSSRSLMKISLELLISIGVERALILHSYDGLDEISVVAPTAVIEIRPGSVREYVVRPEDFGIVPQPTEAMLGGTTMENAEGLHRVLRGDAAELEPFSFANAAAALLIADRVSSLREGYDLARVLVRTGAADANLRDLITRSARAGAEG